MSDDDDDDDGEDDGDDFISSNRGLRRIYVEIRREDFFFVINKAQFLNSTAIKYTDAMLCHVVKPFCFTLFFHHFFPSFSADTTHHHHQQHHHHHHYQ